jgi:hypothetical protein
LKQLAAYQASIVLMPEAVRVVLVAQAQQLAGRLVVLLVVKAGVAPPVLAVALALRVTLATAVLAVTH